MVGCINVLVPVMVCTDCI